jgi:hypothetical protein
MSYDCNMEIVGDGTVRFRGVDFEGRKLTVHKKQGDIIVINVRQRRCSRNSRTGRPPASRIA